MTWWHSHPNAAAIMRRHWNEAELLVVARQGPCIEIRDEEILSINRVPRALDLEGLRAWAADSGRPRSSMIAVLVCSGERLDELVDIVHEFEIDPDRLHFYLHKAARTRTLEPWAKAGYALRHVDEGIEDWRGLHKLLGIDFNVRIVEDFVGSPDD